MECDRRCRLINGVSTSTEEPELKWTCFRSLMDAWEWEDAASMSEHIQPELPEQQSTQQEPAAASSTGYRETAKHAS
jgi:hypothetical protein